VARQTPASLFGVDLRERALGVRLAGPVLTGDVLDVRADERVRDASARSRDAGDLGRGQASLDLVCSWRVMQARRTGLGLSGR